MIEIITEQKLIVKLQKKLIQQLKKVCNEKIVCTVGVQGSSDEKTVYYSQKYNFWFTSHESHNKYWNALTVGRPSINTSNSINVEINIPFKGTNRNIGGAFGVNNKGEVLLLHRGKIGGGRVGVGKQLFFDNLRGDFVTANDNGSDTDFLVISSLNSKLFPKQVANFVSEVLRIKELTKSNITNFSDLNKFSYTTEHSGITKVTQRKITIERTHGIVVNALVKLLEQDGHQIGNDRNRDLFIHKRGQIKSLFEVKTSSSTQDLYSAVGQLLIYSIPLKSNVDLYLVLPDKLSKPVTNRLEELGLKIIYYYWQNNEPLFKNIKEVL